MESIRGKKDPPFIFHYGLIMYKCNYSVQGAPRGTRRFGGEEGCHHCLSCGKLPCPLCMSTVIITDFEKREKFVFPLIYVTACL